MFGFNVFETCEVAFEVYIGDKIVKRQIMQAPQEMLIANFLQLAKQIENDPRPMKIKMLRQDIIWDNFENRQRTLNNEVSVSNNAMTAFEENKQGENLNEDIKK